MYVSTNMYMWLHVFRGCFVRPCETDCSDIADFCCFCKVRVEQRSSPLVGGIVVSLLIAQATPNGTSVCILCISIYNAGFEVLNDERSNS